jgi:hypothetical protein
MKRIELKVDDPLRKIPSTLTIKTNQSFPHLRFPRVQILSTSQNNLRHALEQQLLNNVSKNLNKMAA